MRIPHRLIKIEMLDISCVILGMRHEFRDVEDGCCLCGSTVELFEQEVYIINTGTDLFCSYSTIGNN